MKFFKLLFILGLCAIGGYQIYQNLTPPYLTTPAPETQTSATGKDAPRSGFLPVPWIGGASRNAVLIVGPT